MTALRLSCSDFLILPGFIDFTSDEVVSIRVSSQHDCWLAAVPADYGCAKGYERRPRIDKTQKGLQCRDARLFTDDPASQEKSARRSLLTVRRSLFCRYLSMQQSTAALFPSLFYFCPMWSPTDCPLTPSVYSCVCSAAHLALSEDDRQWCRVEARRGNPLSLHAMPLQSQVHSKGV